MGGYSMTKASTLTLESRNVTRDGPPFIIAEIGVNHDGDMAVARDLIGAAKDTGQAAGRKRRRDEFSTDTGKDVGPASFRYLAAFIQE